MQWVTNYFRTHGIVVNEAMMQPVIRQMDTYCRPLSPAGAADDPVGHWTDSEGREHVLTEAMLDRINRDNGTNYNPNDPNWNQILTSPAFANLISQSVGAIGNTVVGVANSANKTPYGYSPNNYGGLGGGYGSGYGGSGGIWGGFNSNSGSGSGYLNWTPILIGGAVVIILGVGLVMMSQRSGK
jgi:hypothetical protein